MKGNSAASSLITKKMIQKKLKDLEKMEVFITSRVKVLLGNKYYSDIHIVYKKTVVKRKKMDLGL